MFTVYGQYVLDLRSEDGSDRSPLLPFHLFFVHHDHDLQLLLIVIQFLALPCSSFNCLFMAREW